MSEVHTFDAVAAGVDVGVGGSEIFVGLYAFFIKLYTCFVKAQVFNVRKTTSGEKNNIVFLRFDDFSVILF